MMFCIKKITISMCVLGAATGFAVASPTCGVTIHSDDQIRWDVHDIKVSKSCETFTVKLIHDGHLDKGVMGHDWVLTKAQDKDDVVKSVMTEKETNYLSDDPRIIAHTKLLGGGQVSTITFAVNKLEAGQQYSYFCSYPEHISLMHGTLELID